MENDEEDMNMFEFEEIGEGNKFMAVKPWEGLLSLRRITLNNQVDRRNLPIWIQCWSECMDTALIVVGTILGFCLTVSPAYSATLFVTVFPRYTLSSIIF